MAVNLRFEDLRARDNQKIDRDFFNKRYRLLAGAITALSEEIGGIASDSDNLVSLGLVRVNEVLGPLLAKVQAASQEGFLVAESATSVKLTVGLETTLEITGGWQRDLFQPTPYVLISRANGAVDDWALFKVDTYVRENGGLAGEVTAISGAVDAAAYDDWVVSASAGLAKTIMENAAAAQVAISDAQDAAQAAQAAAAAAEDVIATGPVSSVNGRTGVVALGMSDIPNLVSALAAKAAGNHGHEINEVSGLVNALAGKAASGHVHGIDQITALQGALNGKAATGHGHEIGTINGLQAALDAAGTAVGAVKDAAYTAKGGDVILADTSGGAFVLTLPATPAVGASIVIADYDGSWGTNPVTIARNGETIQGAAGDLIADSGGALVWLFFTGDTWRAYIAAGAAGGAAVTADGAEALTNKTVNFAQNTVTVDGTNAPGFLGIPFVAQVTSATVLTAAHKGKCVPVGTGGSIEVPNGVFAAGDAVSLINNTGDDVTITCTITAAYVAGTDEDKATITLAPRGIATILFGGGAVCTAQGNVS
jgi:hypothetical protein